MSKNTTTATTATIKEQTMNTADRLYTKTNGQARPVLTGYDLTQAERDSLDYVDWAAVEAGTDSFSGFRYRGSLYDLSEFEIAGGTLASDWHAWQPESAFSAVAVRYVEGDNYGGDDAVVVGYLHW